MKRDMSFDVEPFIDYSGGYKRLKCCICGLQQDNFTGSNKRAIKGRPKNTVILHNSLSETDQSGQEGDESEDEKESAAPNHINIIHTCRFERCGKSFPKLFNLKRHEASHENNGAGLAHRHCLIDSMNQIYLARLMVRGPDVKVHFDMKTLICSGTQCLNFLSIHRPQNCLWAH